MPLLRIEWSHYCTSAAETSMQCFLVGHLSGPKIAPSCGGSRPHPIHGSMDPRESAPQIASRSVQPFLHSSPVCSTDRQTHRQTDTQTCATFVAIGRMKACRRRSIGLPYGLSQKEDTFSHTCKYAKITMQSRVYYNATMQITQIRLHVFEYLVLTLSR